MVDTKSWYVAQPSLHDGDCNYPSWNLTSTASLDNESSGRQIILIDDYKDRHNSIRGLNLRNYGNDRQY